jgi:hypothetical protein
MFDAFARITVMCTCCLLLEAETGVLRVVMTDIQGLLYKYVSCLTVLYKHMTV